VCFDNVEEVRPKEWKETLAFCIYSETKKWKLKLNVVMANIFRKLTFRTTAIIYEITFR